MTDILISISISGDPKRIQEAARQVENYAASLTGVAVRVMGRTNDNRKAA